jgi:hypothetical protein
MTAAAATRSISLTHPHESATPTQSTHTTPAHHPPDLLGDLPQHVDLLHACVTLSHACHDVIQPACALTAGRALTTALVLVEVRQPGGGGG